MIVALEYIWLQSTGSIFMREVEAEEEAFAEMRSFLKVNKIPSDGTYVTVVEEHEYAGRIIPKHKEVRMFQRGYLPPAHRKYPDPCFGIYYGSDRPAYGHLGSLEKYKLKVKKNGLGEVVKDENGHPVLVNDYYTEGNKWYMPLRVYLDDLAKRTESEKQCH